MADLKQLARLIFQETVVGVEISAVMEREMCVEGSMLHCGDIAVQLRDFSQIRVVAIGKAAHAMLGGLRALLPPEIEFRGIASAPAPPNHSVPGVQYFVGGHPTPNAESRRAAESILSLLAKCDETTLVFFLLSGGGSALVELPLDLRLTLEDVQQLYQPLVTSRPPLPPINAVRKHLSAVNSGRLAAPAGGAPKTSFSVAHLT